MVGRFRHVRLLVLLLLLGSVGGLVWLSSSSTNAASSIRAPTTGTTAAATSGAPIASAPPASPVHVVGLGDSVMSGTNCDCAGIVAEYATALQKREGRPVVGDNLGVPGDTTSDLLDHLRTDGAFRAAVAQADVVLVTIGANDLGPQWQQWQSSSCDDECYEPAVAQMRGRLDAILALVTSLRVGPPATVLVTNYWNVFTDGDVARASGGQEQIDWSTDVTRAVNDAICWSAAVHHARCVDLYTPLQQGDPTGVLAPDGDHPNAAGVAVIVRALLGSTP